MLIGMKKKKHVLLEDKMFGWLQICTAVSLADVNDKKEFCFLANQSVFPILQAECLSYITYHRF